MTKTAKGNEGVSMVGGLTCGSQSSQLRKEGNEQRTVDEMTTHRVVWGRAFQDMGRALQSILHGQGTAKLPG